MRTHHLPIQGATCQGCAKKIRTALGAVPGADEIQVDLDEQTVTVRGDARPEALTRALAESGYGVKPAPEPEPDPKAATVPGPAATSSWRSPAPPAPPAFAASKPPWAAWPASARRA